MCTVGTQYDAVCLQEIVSAVSNSVFSVAQMMQAVSVKCAEVQSSLQGSQTLLLEAHCPAEFRSSQLQHTCLKVSSTKDLPCVQMLILSSYV